MAELKIAVLNPSESVHISLPRNQGVRTSGNHSVVIHRERTPWASAGIPGIVGGPTPVVPVADALARLLRCAPVDEALVSVDSALNYGLVTLRAIGELLQAPYASAARQALTLADSRSQSVTETLARLALVRAGFRPIPQAEIAGVGRVDLLVDGFLVLELDGFAYHANREQFRNDRRRDRALRRLGYDVLRYAYEDVIGDPQQIVRDVQFALAAARAGTAVRRPESDDGAQF